MTYLDFRHNVHSANGEDGIIKKLFSDLDITNGIVCEFGAHDGFHDSNTAALWEQNYQAILIEPDGKRFSQLQKNTSEHDVECIHTGVQKEREGNIKNTIDDILERSKFNITPDNFSLMSIDIDSYDYYVFKSIEKYFPKVLIFEVSSGHPINDDFISEDKGCSIKSAYELGIEKGYKMICHCGNVIFVRNDLTYKLPDYDYSIENLHLGTNCGYENPE